ncbi:MAG: hypothetical protein EOO02_08500 [Chitinophagaceae bacterium]|nr:MAG: hypothetical protein EOO02_08500 [Chitinophagaceae bacterium]
MVSKTTIAFLILLACTCYLVAPWIFEKKLLFNELLAGTGFLLLAYHRFRIGKDLISVCIIMIIVWGVFHMITSLFLMDRLYYYLRNLVIIYSMMSFFVGYFLLKYLDVFLRKTGVFMKTYIVTLLILPLNSFIFDRFSTATIFPAVLKDVKNFLLPWLLITMNIIHAFTYESSTAILVAGFFCLLFISPGYKFFKQVVLLMFVSFICLFIYLLPYLDLIKDHYSPYTETGIYDVINSHPLLSVDGNSTWRLVLWKQIIVDNFPRNLFGYGFGTPMISYYPVEDFSKVESLPYILGAHNSFVYLFGRLGIVYLLLIVPVYINILKEYFYHKQYYLRNNQSLIFLSFFAITVISLFNPTLESPIYSGGYWLLLGFTARCIHNRIYLTAHRTNESFVYT